jgi:hypothetical protein
LLVIPILVLTALVLLQGRDKARPGGVVDSSRGVSERDIHEEAREWCEPFGGVWWHEATRPGEEVSTAARRGVTEGNGGFVANGGVSGGGGEGGEVAGKLVVCILPGRVSVGRLGEEKVSPRIGGGVGRRVLLEKTGVGDRKTEEKGGTGDESMVREFMRVGKAEERHGALREIMGLVGMRRGEVRLVIGEGDTLASDCSESLLIRGRERTIESMREDRFNMTTDDTLGRNKVRRPGESSLWRR